MKLISISSKRRRQQQRRRPRQPKWIQNLIAIAVLSEIEWYPCTIDIEFQTDYRVINDTCKNTKMM